MIGGNKTEMTEDQFYQLASELFDEPVDSLNEDYIPNIQDLPLLLLALEKDAESQCYVIEFKEHEVRNKTLGELFQVFYNKFQNNHQFITAV